MRRGLTVCVGAALVCVCVTRILDTLAQGESSSLAWNVSLLSGTPGLSGTTDGDRLVARLSEVGQIWGHDGFVYVADTNNSVIRKINATTGTATTFAGSPALQGAIDGVGSAARFRNPWGLWGGGNVLYVADTNNNAIRVVPLDGSRTSTLVGGGPGSAGTGFQDGAGPLARFHFPSEIWGDGENLYVTDWGNHAIRKIVIATRTVSTVAGGSLGSADGIGTNASFNHPEGIWGHNGFLYVSEQDNHTIRRIEIATGAVTTFAGMASSQGHRDVIGTSARFNNPWGLWGDGSYLYVADRMNNVIRRISLSTRQSSTVSGSPGDTGAVNGTGASARFHNPQGIWGDGTNLYVSDSKNFTVRKLTPSTGPVLSLSDRGSRLLSTSGTGAVATVGYGRLNALPNSSTPFGIALFSYRQGGVLVSEAAVPATVPVISGRIYAEVNGPVNTGVAMANPSDQAANVSFYFINESGVQTSAGTTTIDPGAQIARFLDQEPFSGGSLLKGSFTFQSDTPIAVIALRGYTNERSEFLITTLPVVRLGGVSGGNLNFPHFADGDGWSTQLVLVNPTDELLTGVIQFYDPGTGSSAAQPVSVQMDGVSASSFSYTLSARSARSYRTSGSGPLRTGSVRTNAIGSPAPAGTAVFSYRTNGVTVTEAGVPALRSAIVQRMYVESTPGFAAATAGSIQSGMAISNPSSSPALAQLELYDSNGAFTGLTADIPVPGNGQVAMFLNQVPAFASLPPTFRGLLRLSGANSTGLNLVGLRGRYNERGEFLITTTAPIEESIAPSSAEAIFPHLVDSGGYRTEFVLFTGYRSTPSSGVLELFSQGGERLPNRVE